jgi:hypothetical protein
VDCASLALQVAPVSYYCLKNIIGFRPKLGNTYYHITAIQYFLSMRLSRIVLSYNSTHQIVVKYLSKRCQSYRMEAAMGFFLHNTDDTEKAVL